MIEMVARSTIGSIESKGQHAPIGKLEPFLDKPMCDIPKLVEELLMPLKSKEKRGFLNPMGVSAKTEMATLIPDDKVPLPPNWCFSERTYEGNSSPHPPCCNHLRKAFGVGCA